MRRSAVMFDFRERGSPRRTTVFLVFALGAALGVAGGNWLGGRTAEQRALEAAHRAREQLAAEVCAEAFLDRDAAQAALARLTSLAWARSPELRAEETVARLCAGPAGAIIQGWPANGPSSKQ